MSARHNRYSTALKKLRSRIRATAGAIVEAFLPKDYGDLKPVPIPIRTNPTLGRKPAPKIWINDR